MPLRSRSAALAVLLFTTMAVAMLWGLSWRAQTQLQAQVVERELNRSGLLAEAMAGKVEALFSSAALAAGQLRDEWLRHPASFEAEVREVLTLLPAGLVSHVTVVDATGRVVFNSLSPAAGGGVGTELGDRPYFQQARASGELVISPPVKGRIVGQWLVVMAQPIVREGRFDGAVHLLLPTDYLSTHLARLSLSPLDAVALLHPDGSFMARSVEHDAAMGTRVREDRPFLQPFAPGSGLFRERGSVDGVTRLFAWYRLRASGLVVVAGLGEAAVLEPVLQSRQQAYALTGGLSLLLLAGGAWLYGLLGRLEASRKQARQSAERLEQAQHMASLGHWSYDAAARRLNWSDEVFTLFGQTPGLFDPTEEAFCRCLHPEDSGLLRAAYEQSRRDGLALDLVVRIQRPDGVWRHLRLLSASRPADGAAFVSEGTVQDITELREAQLALQQLNADLEHRVRVRTEELRALNRELEAFTYSVAHDLRTPLRSIHGFAALLQESGAQGLDEQGRDHLRRIQEGSRRMGHLITDLLSLAHHSRAEMHHEWVDLSALARQVAAELALGEPQRQVQWSIAPGLRAWADPTLARVVLQNLLGNAWKYTGQTENAHIRFDGRGAPADGLQAFCVQDNGAGFDMAYADQLFQPFKRLHAHHLFEGTGIGLATVARVVQRHGGWVRGEGAVGQGATFCFSLPAGPAQPAADS